MQLVKSSVKARKGKKIMPIFYSRTIPQTFLICITLIFPKGIFWKNKVQLLWHLSNSVCLIFPPLKLTYKIWSSSWTRANAYTVVDLETISTNHYILNK